MKEEKKLKVAPAQAEEWFEDWCDAMDIDTDAATWDEDDRTDFDRLKRVITRAITKGHVMFNENGELEYTPWRPATTCKGDVLTFHERTGASMMASDTKKRGKDVTKMYAILADMTKRTPKDFAGMAGSDIKLCETVFVLLMA